MFVLKHDYIEVTRSRGISAVLNIFVSRCVNTGIIVWNNDINALLHLQYLALIPKRIYFVIRGGNLHLGCERNEKQHSLHK